MKKNNSKRMLNIKIILAVVGFIIIVLTGKMTHYRFHDYNDIIQLELPLIILGILLMLPIAIYIIRRR